MNNQDIKSPKNLSIKLLLTIFIKPKKTMNLILKNNPTFMVDELTRAIAIMMLIGIVSNDISDKSLIEIIFQIVLAFLYPYVVFRLLSYLIYFCGKLLKGEGKPEEIYTAVLWGGVPYYIFSISSFAIFYFIVGFNIEDMKNWLTPTNATPLILLGLVTTAYYIWVFCQAIAAAQKFSGFKAFLNSILSFMVVPVTLVAGLLAFKFVLGLIFN